MTREDLAQECALKNLNAPKVTQEHIDSIIVGEQYHQFPGTTVTICLLTLKNGFTAVGDSACASPENFDPEVGRMWAKKKAADGIWKLEGYLLKQNLYNLANSNFIAGTLEQTHG